MGIGELFSSLNEIRQRCNNMADSVDWETAKDGKVKTVKCTLVQALRLCTGRAAHKGSRGIAILFDDHDTRRG